jgi:hypothetical protein
MANGYNLDFYAKTIFEKEIEKIDNGYQVDVGNMPFDKVKEYLQQRIKEINEEYEETVATTR